MLITYQDEDEKPTIINTPEKPIKSSDGINKKKLFEILKAEALHYLERDCNAGVKLATKSNILFSPDEKNKEILIKGFALGKLCLTNVDHAELARIIGKYGYGFRLV